MPTFDWIGKSDPDLLSDTRIAPFAMPYIKEMAAENMPFDFV